MTLIFSNTETKTAKQLIQAALDEDLNNIGDLTCNALIPKSLKAEVNLVARENGIVAGLPIANLVFESLDTSVSTNFQTDDGNEIKAGQVLATFSGPLNSLLIGERTILNFMTHLSGIASLTQKYVQKVSGTKAVVLDTRKTLPGYRALAKYAVRAGGGTNHRIGLYDGILIKDNHLASWASQSNQSTIAEAIQTARKSVEENISIANNISIEVEVDTLEQLEDALDGPPDIVLLDNMTTEQLKKAIQTRNQKKPYVLLEASGGITLETVQEIAETGVDRISIGALTHSAPSLDLAFDWKY